MVRVILAELDSATAVMACRAKRAEEAASRQATGPPAAARLHREIRQLRAMAQGVACAVAQLTGEMHREWPPPGRPR